jgi:hypothetical protein
MKGSWPIRRLCSSSGWVRVSRLRSWYPKSRESKAQDTTSLSTSIALNSFDAEWASTLLWTDCSPQAETRKSKVQQSRGEEPKSGWPFPSLPPALRHSNTPRVSRVHAKCHGLSRVVSRVDAHKRPVFIDLSRCHGSRPLGTGITKPQTPNSRERSKNQCPK